MSSQKKDENSNEIIDAIIDLSDRYSGSASKFVKALEFVFSGMEMTKCDFILYAGNILMERGRIPSAINLWQEVLRTYNCDKKWHFMCSRNMGLAYQDLNYFDNSIKYLKRALSLAKELEDKISQAECYWMLGQCYSSLGDFNTSTDDYYMPSLDILAEIKEKDFYTQDLEVNCNRNLADALAYSKYADDQIKHCWKCHKTKRK